MSDLETRKQLLIDEVFPAPPPPPDMAARVLAAMDRQRAPRTRRGPLVAAASVAALAAGLAFVWMQWGSGRVIEEDGGWIAAERSTVDIGSRAAAAMEPGADLKWSVRKERVRVQQRRGSVFYRVDRGGPFQVSTPDGDVEVTGTCFRITHAARGLPGESTLVTVLEGSVNVRTAAGTLSLKVGETARLWKDRRPQALGMSSGEAAAAHDEELRERAAPEVHTVVTAEASEPARARAPERASALLLPPSTRLRVFGNPLDKVSLALPAGKHGGIEVARDPGFRRQVFSGPARGPFVTVPAPERGDLYWRVAGQSDLAGHARFLPDARAGSGRAVANVVSEGRPSTTINFQGPPPALTLAFAESPGAVGYRVRVYRMGVEQPILERTVADARCAVAAGTLSDGHYLWTVVPLDDGGRALGERPMNKLELAYDNARSTLAITRVGDGEVQGVAPLGARLYVNGAGVEVDDKGRFSLKAGGERVLVFRLVESDGAESYWVRSLAARPQRKTL
jgi:ferric-dicitrate binding protein FerR (iron transport regulator)